MDALQTMCSVYDCFESSHRGDFCSGECAKRLLRPSAVRNQPCCMYTASHCLPGLRACMWVSMLLQRMTTSAVE